MIKLEQFNNKRKRIEKIAEWGVKYLTFKFLDKVDMLSPFQKEAIEAVELMIKDPTCDIFWAPEDARFIKNENYFVKLYSERITITQKKDNKTGHYETRIPEHVYNKLVSKIDEEMTLRIIKIENSIMEEVSDLLSDLKEDLKLKVDDKDKEI